MNERLFSVGRFEILFSVFSIIGFVVNPFTNVTLATRNTALLDVVIQEGPNHVGVQPNSWRGITPLRSTRVDVERLLQRPISSRHSTVVYETNEEQITVVYSAGKCVLSGSERWNVPSNVVITIQRRPKKPILIQDLHLDPNKYPRFQQSHPENWFLYRNKEEGVMIETVLFENKEQIDSISYFPTRKENNLRCSSTHNRNKK